MDLKGEKSGLNSDNSKINEGDTDSVSIRSETRASFVNGIIVGAGAVVAMMAYAFTRFVGQIEGIQNVTTTETRVAILLGGIVAAAAAGYEIYRKKGSPSVENEKNNSRSKKEEESSSYQHASVESSQKQNDHGEEEESKESNTQGTDKQEK